LGAIGRGKRLTLGAAAAALLSMSLVNVASEEAASRFLVTWVGDADAAESDFLAVLDVSPGSATFGQVVRTVPVDARGTDPHHTEHFFTPAHPLFANGFRGNRSFRFDLTDPSRPTLAGGLEPVPGLAFPHSFARLPNGNVLATMQANDASYAPPGGLAEFRDDGTVVRSRGASNDVDPGARPYSLLVLPERDRVIVACGRMGIGGGDVGEHDHQGFTVQLWRLSDLQLLRTVALTAPPGSRVNLYPYEPRQLPGGEILLVSGTGGLFRIAGTDAETFAAQLVYDFGGGGAAVPVVVGHYWIQPVGALRRVVALDVKDASRPVEVSRIEFDERQRPHWLALDEPGNRIVVTNRADGEARMWMLRVDPASGALSLDATFRDPRSDRPGVDFGRDRWPHGTTGGGLPHGSVFVR
jgi:hypothetical protein